MDKTVKEKLPAEPNAYMIDRAVRYLRDASSSVALEDIFVCAILDFLEQQDVYVPAHEVVQGRLDKRYVQRYEMFCREKGVEIPDKWILSGKSIQEHAVLMGEFRTLCVEAGKKEK